MERRRQSRLGVGISSVVRYCVAGGGKARKEAKVQDIALGGLRFMAGERLEIGTPLDLEIYLISKEGVPISIGGKVVWQRGQETGVSLDQMEEADQTRFTDFVFSTLHQLFKR